MSIEIPDGEFAACFQYIGTVMFLDTWFPTQGEPNLYPHIELTSCKLWDLQKKDF